MLDLLRLPTMHTPCAADAHAIQYPRCHFEGQLVCVFAANVIMVFNVFLILVSISGLHGKLLTAKVSSAHDAENVLGGFSWHGVHSMEQHVLHTNKPCECKSLMRSMPRQYLYCGPTHRALAVG